MQTSETSNNNTGGHGNGQVRPSRTNVTWSHQTREGSRSTATWSLTKWYEKYEFHLHLAHCEVPVLIGDKEKNDNTEIPIRFFFREYLDYQENVPAQRWYSLWLIAPENLDRNVYLSVYVLLELDGFAREDIMTKIVLTPGEKMAEIKQKFLQVSSWYSPLGRWLPIKDGFAKNVVIKLSITNYFMDQHVEVVRGDQETGKAAGDHDDTQLATEN